MKIELGLIPVVIVMVSSLAILWHLKWRWIYAFLILQYLAEFLLVMQSLSFGLALIKVLVGLVCGAVLISSPSFQRSKQENSDRSGQILRSLVAIFIWLIVFFSAPALQSWLKINPEIITASFILLGIGLLQLGMTTQPVYVAIGLLTVLAGFEVLYSALETSVLLAGLLAVVNLGIALVGAYLAALPHHEEMP